MKNYEKVGLNDPSTGDTYTDHCKECREEIELDEILAHCGYCHRCNPVKTKGLDQALKEMEPFYLRQVAKDILRKVIKEEKPQSIEELRDMFWFHLANDKELCSKRSEFQKQIDFAIQDLMEAGVFEEKVA